MVIEVTNIDPAALVRAVYSLSIPRGMGFLHFVPNNELSDDEVASHIRRDGTIHMDYVYGRGCKFHTWARDGKLFMDTPWYDHTDADLKKLCQMCGIALPSATPETHNDACACPECEKARQDR